ncbi:hypothetical protein Gotri_026930 [Gossypium trilobum]|uniref:DUF4283 domain-containing protein n=1 Tax=Gossypium trilobum TaxID=34281 RepID=A0A7J9FI17_9ROSI|nr:hypothetical protein [Gossypium trilobum]MBA0784625.1 hypothetical protein [Gossypium trilobum]
MANVDLVDTELANLKIIDEEEDPMVVLGENIADEQLAGGEEPNSIPLWHTAFWVQVHNLPIGVTSEGTARQLGDFVGKFMEYDSTLIVTFCFICGRLGHGESYYEVRLTLGNQQVEFGWDLSLRAMPRRGGQAVSKWLREEPEKDKWNDIEIDGERRLRRFNVEVTNRNEFWGK